MAVGTYINPRHGTKTISVFLPADREASWLLLPSWVFLPSDGTRLVDVVKHQPHKVFLS